MNQSLANDPEFGKLRAALQEAKERIGPSFYAFSISARRSESLQSLYFGDVGEGLIPYQERSVTDQIYSIRIYARHGEPVRMGSAAVTVDPFFDPGEQIERCYANALAVSNPPWDLPPPPGQPYATVETADPQIMADPAGTKRTIEERVRRIAQGLRGVLLNSAELYVNRHHRYTETSTSICMESEATDLYFEAAMEKLPLPNTQEVHRYVKSIGLADLELDRFFEESVRETMGLDQTALPKSGSAALLLDRDVISDLLHAVVSQLDGELEYRNLPCLRPGDRIAKEGGGDPITLLLDPFLPLMAESAPFTEEGLAVERATVIENGTVRCQTVSYRMGQYLNRSHNGIAGNMVLAPGSRTREELISSVDECLEIITFASLLINPTTLTWSSEIKLAKLHRRGGEPVMIKGGVVSGSIKENLSDCLLGSNIVKKNVVADQWSPSKGYVGPDFMLVRSGVSIAGE